MAETKKITYGEIFGIVQDAFCKCFAINKKTLGPQYRAIVHRDEEVDFAQEEQILLDIVNAFYNATGGNVSFRNDRRIAYMTIEEIAQHLAKAAGIPESEIPPTTQVVQPSLTGVIMATVRKILG